MCHLDLRRVLLLALLAAVATLVRAADLSAELLARPGPFAVETITQEWTDASRLRTLPVQIYMPAGEAGDSRPTIIFSHGLGGSRRGGAAWGRHWASHGFIAIHVQHPGSDEALWMNRGDVPAKDAMLKGFTPKAFLDRAADVRFVIDEIGRRAQAGDRIARRVDVAHLGMSGHSFGARTTQVIAGERLPFATVGARLSDPRFKAAIALSPAAAGPEAQWGKRFGEIAIPFLAITGTRDGDQLGGSMPPAQRTEVFRHMPPGDKYLLVLEGASHLVFNGGEERGPADERRIADRDVKIASLAFWKAYLEDDADAKQFLQGSGMRTALGADGMWATK